MNVMVIGLPTAFGFLLSAYCDQLATGFFFEEVTEISTAVASYSNEPYCYRLVQWRFLCLYILALMVGANGSLGFIQFE
jgi:hypothetical protein